MPRSRNRRLPALLVLGLLLVAVLLVANGATAQGDHASRGGHTLVVPAGSELVGYRGWHVRHEYGSYDLIDIEAGAWAALPQKLKEQVFLADHMDDFVGVGSKPRSAAQAVSRANPAGKALHLIQFSGPIQERWLGAVEAEGAQLVHYVPQNGYLVWADAAARRRLDGLAAAGDFVRLSLPYPATAKMPTAAQMPADETVTVTIQMLAHDRKAASEARIAALAQRMLSPWEAVLAFQNATAVVRASDIAAIAALPDVIVVEPFTAPQRLDEKQAQTLTGNLSTDGTGPNGPGYLTWLNALGFSADPAQYPIVDIVDDGLGNGIRSQAGGDVTLRVGGEPAGASRVMAITDCTEEGNGRGDDGHGHINASIAAGFDLRAGAPFRDAQEFQYGLGVNPHGRLASTRVFDSMGYYAISGCGDSYPALIRHSYAQGARLLSNSWGCSACAGSYNLASQAYDAGTRDSDPLTPGDQALLAIFSAGNSGPDLGTVGSPADGKNVIAVGAVENQRPSWTDWCGYGPAEADNVQDIADYSSRGPGSGGRVKPDLVAPGTHVIGTASTSPFYNGLAVCDPYYPPEQTIFAASTGTSHSAPAVAGAASLAIWWLQNKLDIPDPSPALVKALLIASATPVTGVGSDGELPSASQGYGLPDLSEAFVESGLLVLDQDGARTFNASGQVWSTKLYTAVAGEPLKIVLAYTDQPGLVAEWWEEELPPQVNDLDLIVRAGEETYYGNVTSDGWSSSAGQPDRLNNVEMVTLPADTAGDFEVEVMGFSIAGDGVPNAGDGTDQDFALVCLNCLDQPPVERIVIYAYLPFVPAGAGR